RGRAQPFTPARKLVRVEAVFHYPDRLSGVTLPQALGQRFGYRYECVGPVAQAARFQRTFNAAQNATGGSNVVVRPEVAEVGQPDDFRVTCLEPGGHDVHSWWRE